MDYLHFTNLLGEYMYLPATTFITVNDVIQFILKHNQFISCEQIQMISNGNYLHMTPMCHLPINSEIHIWVKNNVDFTNCIIDMLYKVYPVEHYCVWYKSLSVKDDTTEIIIADSESESDTEYYEPFED